MDEKLLTLPWQIQLALGAGYAAYAVAYSGIREHHKPVDTTFRSLAFGLLAVGALYLLPHNRPVFSGALAFSIAVAGGVIWCVFGIVGVRAAMRLSNVSWADDTPSAWARLQGDSRNVLTQISALLDDETWVRCDNAYSFKNAPHGPCILGTNGDLALYVTHVELKDGTEQEAPATHVDGWGDQLTYIPAAKIRQVVIRYRRDPRGWQRLWPVLRGWWSARGRR